MSAAPGHAPLAMTRPSAAEIQSLDPYAFLAVLGKRVIHPGGRRSTQQVLELAGLAAGQHVLDIGCGVATTAIQAAQRFHAHVTAADLSPLMLARAHRNVASAGLDGHVKVEQADILPLPYPDGAFDRIIAEAVTMFVDRPWATAELARVCRPDGRVLATEFCWQRHRRPRPARRSSARSVPAAGRHRPAMEPAGPAAGLTGLQVADEMMTPAAS